MAMQTEMNCLQRGLVGQSHLSQESPDLLFFVGTDLLTLVIGDDEFAQRFLLMAWKQAEPAL